MPVVITSFFIIIFLLDIYIYFSFIHKTTTAKKIIFLIQFLLNITLMIILCTGHISGIVIKLFICLFFPKLLFVIISIIGRIFGLINHNIYTIFNYIGVVILILSISAAVYGSFFGWKHLEIKETNLFFDNLPKKFDNYRIVQLSDIHVGAFGENTKFVKRIIDETNKLNPDLIVFTGDIVDTEAEELIPFLNLFPLLKAKDGVISIIGNHDYCFYGNHSKEDQIKNFEKVKQYEKEFGWNLLLNENKVIKCGNDSIAVIGIENGSKPPFPDFSDLTKALKNISNNTFKILLSHDPIYWRHAVVDKTNIDLTLSGHTHAAHLRIGKISPASWFYNEWEGLHIKGKQQLYISTGLGGTLQFRVGAWPQIELITLKCKV